MSNTSCQELLWQDSDPAVSPVVYPAADRHAPSNHHPFLQKEQRLSFI